MAAVLSSHRNLNVESQKNSVDLNRKKFFAGNKLMYDYIFRSLDGNVRRMHTAVTMNQVIKERSAQAQLVILNLPKPPKSHRELNEMNCK